eukprot:jgi/Mesvir1/18971/Mv18937-RA.2
MLQAVSFREAFLPWVAAWLLLYFLQGGGIGSMGLLNNARNFLWINVSQYTFRAVSLDAFVHLLNLPLKFHLTRRTGEVMRVMERGTWAIQSVLQSLLFNVAPTLIDIVVACSYIGLKMDAYLSAIVFATLIVYIPMSIFITEWRGKFKKEMNDRENEMGHRGTDALLNYETVKYFSAEQREKEHYLHAIVQYQAKEWVNEATLCGLNVAQNCVIMVGLVSGMVLCTLRATEGLITVGDVVFFISYMLQLYMPLNWFATYYRSLQQNLINMDNLAALLEQEVETEWPDARPLALPPPVADGTPQGSSPWDTPLASGPKGVSIRFYNVWFSYGEGASAMPVLRGLSFHVPGGGSLALVGRTGSGKSSVLRLIFRFYLPQSGAISVEGQNVERLKLKSLREHIAVVPQDSVLFNDTVEYNIRYGNASASDEDVRRAAQAAHIHEAIMTRFPNGYQTVVGERGLRLSGGEKQRVALARAFLKKPAIMLLDEATSSLDSLTEKLVMEALLQHQHKCTTVTVAHRLSTIVGADEIVLLADGEVRERGTHAALLELNAEYAEMWQRQSEVQGGVLPES